MRDNVGICGIGRCSSRPGGKSCVRLCIVTIATSTALALLRDRNEHRGAGQLAFFYGWVDSIAVHNTNNHQVTDSVRRRAGSPYILVLLQGEVTEDDAPTEEIIIHLE